MIHLSGYLRAQFWQQLNTIQEVRGLIDNTKLDIKIIMAANAASPLVFNMIQNITPNAETYYISKGYKEHKDSKGNIFYFNESKKTKLHIQHFPNHDIPSTIVTKYHEEDGHDLTPYMLDAIGRNAEPDAYTC